MRDPNEMRGWIISTDNGVLTMRPPSRWERTREFLFSIYRFLLSPLVFLFQLSMTLRLHFKQRASGD